MKKYDVIIVNYNAEKIIARCLESIYSSTVLPTRVIVYDNNSKDGSTSIIKKEFPKVVLIEGKTNIGFGRANNEAMKRSRAEFILFMNNDVLLDNNCAGRLLEGFRGNNIAVNNPLIYKGWEKKKNQQVYAFGAELNRAGFNYGLYDLGANRSDLTSFSAACCMAQASVIKKLKFEKRFFMYGEEAEISCRILKSGLKIGRVKEALCFHLESYSTPGKNIDGIAFRQFYGIQNRWFLIGKDWSLRLFPESILVNILHLVYMLFFFLKNKKYSKLSLVFIAPYSLINGIWHRDTDITVNKKWYVGLGKFSLAKYLVIANKVFNNS